MEKSLIQLKSPLGSGGEASIYPVLNKPDLVAKIYHQPNGEYKQKLTFMIANPPIDPLAGVGRVSIAWAVELVVDSGQVVGFLMPRLDLSKVKPIFHYYNPATRRKESPWFSYVYLLRTARNLARTVRSVHSRGYAIGDVNESNVLVAEDAIVTLVDTDSFQVNDGATTYRCRVGKPEYTPPELQGLSFRDVDRTVAHDLFGLGVLIFQLLMEGNHPYGGVFTGQGEPPELKDRIKAGHFPHGKCKVPYKPMPLAPSFQVLPPALQELFLLCFEEGHSKSMVRPTADMWRVALGDAEDLLVKCSTNEQHHYSNHLSFCPWCERTAKLGGRDPFPSINLTAKNSVASTQYVPPIIKTSTPKNKFSSPILFVKIKSFLSFLRRKPVLVVLIVSMAVLTGVSSLVHNTDPLTLLISSSKLKATFNEHSKYVNSVAFSPDGKILASGSNDMTIKLWNVTTGELISTLSGHSDYVFSVAFSPDGKTLASGIADGTIKLWNVTSGELISTLSGHSDSVRSVAFSPDGEKLASGGSDGTIKLWNVTTGELISTLSGHFKDIWSVAFSPDGEKLASGSGDGTIKLWNISTGELISTLSGQPEVYLSVAFSSGGKTLASGGSDGTIKLWNVTTGELISTLSGHFKDIWSVAFSPDGEKLASGSNDKTIKLWNVTTGELISTLSGHSDYVFSVAFSPDGRALASGSSDNTIKLWRVD